MPGPACSDEQIQGLISQNNALISKTGKRLVWHQVGGGDTLIPQDDSYQAVAETVPTHALLPYSSEVILEKTPTKIVTRSVPTKINPTKFERSMLRSTSEGPSHENPNSSQKLPLVLSLVALLCLCVLCTLCACCSMMSDKRQKPSGARHLACCQVSKQPDNIVDLEHEVSIEDSGDEVQSIHSGDIVCVKGLE
jgi:hypothetical protein